MHGATNDKLSTLLLKYESIFQAAPGDCIQGFEASLKLKPDQQPVFQKARPVPYAMREIVEAELDRLEIMK